MGNKTLIILSIVLCVLLPVGLLCLYLEKKSRRIMLSFIFGVLSCICSFFLNNFVLALLPISDWYLSATVAPIVEEFFKFTPIFITSLILQKGRRGTASMSFAVGVGFCVVENFYYIVKFIDQVSIIWIIIRCIGAGLMHGMSSTVIGLGIYYSRKEKRLKNLSIVSTLFFAMIYHGLFNALVMSERFQFIGVLIPLITYFCIFFVLNKDEIKTFLSDDTSVEKAE